jgi:Leucine-rich repeat (LRR) protein
MQLEILDVGRNKIRYLPPEIANLTSLKVLSVQRNRIEDLPLYLGDMASLQVLKLDGNPIQFPPKEILEPEPSSPPNAGFLKESEVDDVAVTAQVKRFLKQKSIMDQMSAMDGSEAQSAGEESSEGAETPRANKRAMSGRFPIKVNGSDVPDLRSPALPRPPPIPSRSHFRGLSQQNAALRRPGVMPLTIGSTNERGRSNSESLLQASRERADRSRRMGTIASKSKASDLGTVDETKSNRYSHYRGLSHGSAMATSTANNNIHSRSPASPADSLSQRATYVRRLSSLPERKRESQSPDPVVEGAQGILYALFQVHPLLTSLIGLARDPTNKRTSLERVFYNATTHVEELDRDLQRYITYSEEDEEISPRSSENVQNACLTCVSAYIHVCALLSRNVDTLLKNSDPRYIRTLMLMVYGSLAEVRNAGRSLFLDESSRLNPGNVQTNGALLPHIRDKSVTPTRERPNPGNRSRSGTVLHTPNGMRPYVEVQQPGYLSGNSRSGTMTSNLSASTTPRSGESFASASSVGPLRSMPSNGEFTEDDRMFEKIFLRLQQSCDAALQALPVVDKHFAKAMQISIQQGASNQMRSYWQLLSQKCDGFLQTADALKARLSSLKLKEPGVRTQSAFWELCKSFLNVRDSRLLTRPVLTLPRHTMTLLSK